MEIGGGSAPIAPSQPPATRRRHLSPDSPKETSPLAADGKSGSVRHGGSSVEAGLERQEIKSAALVITTGRRRAANAKRLVINTEKGKKPGGNDRNLKRPGR